MSCDTTQKQGHKADRRGPGPLLALMAVFASPSAAAKLFQTVRWANGLACPHCVKDGREGKNVTKYCKYGHLQRYVCKDCNKTFNDKTGTLLHYKHIMVGEWMLAIWMFLSGPRNGISIRFIAESLGRTYKPVYCMMRGIMALLASLPEKVLSGVGETDELYINAGSKGVPLATNGEGRTVPSRRGLPRGPGRGTFEKNTPMTTVYHRRATGEEPDITIFDVPAGHSKTLAEMAAGRFEPGSTIITDEHPAYKSLGQRGYVHPTVNHSEGEYASGYHNEIHTNNCECRAGLVKWWRPCPKICDKKIMRRICTRLPWPVPCPNAAESYGPTRPAGPGSGLGPFAAAFGDGFGPFPGMRAQHPIYAGTVIVPAL